MKLLQDFKTETINFLVNWTLDLLSSILMITQNLMPMKNSTLSSNFWEKVLLELNKLVHISDQGSFSVRFQDHREFDNSRSCEVTYNETVKVQKNRRSEMNLQPLFSDGVIQCNRIFFNQEINFSNPLKIVYLGEITFFISSITWYS